MAGGAGLQIEIVRDEGAGVGIASGHLQDMLKGIVVSSCYGIVGKGDKTAYLLHAPVGVQGFNSPSQRRQGINVVPSDRGSLDRIASPVHWV